MKNPLQNSLFVLFLFFLARPAVAQEQFAIEATGLMPKSIRFQIPSGDSSQQLFQQTLDWIKANEKTYKLTLEETGLGTEMVLTHIKNNAVNLGDRYFHAKYDTKIQFEGSQILFEPIKIQLKVNSKYDMGWNDFDLSSGVEFFKKDKPIKKYRTYLNDLVAPINALHQALVSYLMKD